MTEIQLTEEEEAKLSFLLQVFAHIDANEVVDEVAIQSEETQVINVEWLACLATADERAQPMFLHIHIQEDKPCKDMTFKLPISFMDHSGSRWDPPGPSFLHVDVTFNDALDTVENYKLYWAKTDTVDYNQEF